MHLAIFGGTGGTGDQLIRAALSAGHTVTAPARDPSRIHISHERLRVVRADVLDPSSLHGSMDGADAVASALGVPGGKDPTTMYSAGVANILDAMHAVGVRRFIGVSALPVTPRTEVGVLERLVIYPSCTGSSARATPTWRGWNRSCAAATWTGQSCARQGSPTGGPPTATAPRSTAIYSADAPSPADLAAAMLRLLDDPHTVRTTIGVAY